MGKPIIIASWAVIISAMTLLLWVFWSLLWPFNLLHSDPGAWDVTNANKQVHRGENVLIHWHGCRYTDGPAYISTELEGAILIAMAPRVSTIKHGCFGVDFPIAYIGREIPPGKYTARVIIKFVVNPLRTVTYIYNTDEFEVIGKNPYQ